MECTNGRSERTGHEAEGWLVAPDGRSIQAMCRRHADECIEEFREKLEEEWSFEVGDVE